MLRWLVGKPDEDEVRLPVLKGKHYESSVPGLHIVGDLAGAPTIKIAANQGHDVVRWIAEQPDGRAEASERGDVHDVVIVGGGSSGIAAALEAKACDLSFVVLESGRAANTIREFPRGKEIYAEPATVETVSPLWVEDSHKETLLEKWDAQLAEANLPMREGVKVTAIEREAGCFSVETDVGETFRGRRVLLAIGKRGNPRRLGVPGEELEKVFFSLYEPADHAGENVLVVGGGDSAIEAALALSEHASSTTLSYRRAEFFRLKSRNREKIDAAIADGRVEALFESNVKEIAAKEVRIGLADGERTIANDCTLIAVGADLPHGFFRKIGVRMEKAWTPMRWAALAAVFLLFWLVYTAKHWGDNGKLLPPLSWMGATWNTFQLGEFHLWQWYTLLYSAAVLVFGIRAFRKYSYSKLQKWKYVSVIFSQCFLLCIFPLFIAPRLDPGFLNRASNAWRLVLAWPLSIHALDEPFNDPANFGGFIYAVVLTFVAIPIFTYWFGNRFCSWICGCGALAETLGDEVRHLAPRGPKSILWERMAYAVLWIATIVTFLSMFFSTWILATQGMHLYGIWIDTLLAGAVGVAFYWFMGNRVWCRFFCPLRAYMNLLGKFASRFKIQPSRDKCIACGQCSRQCQMGIPVMDFAKQGEAVTLANSSCIGCGICVDVCPVDVLHYSDEAARAAEPAHLREASK